MVRGKQHYAPRGTTMIEVIVALSVVTLGIIGALNLSLESHSTVGFSKEEIIAANLAREAIDIVRNMRDNNWLQGALWDQGFAGSGVELGGVLNFDTVNNKWELRHVADPLGALDDETSRLYVKDNFYTTAAGAKTHLKRVIKITDAGPGEKKLEAIVRIEFKDIIKDVVVENHLYDWR